MVVCIGNTAEFPQLQISENVYTEWLNDTSKTIRRDYAEQQAIGKILMLYQFVVDGLLSKEHAAKKLGIDVKTLETCLQQEFNYPDDKPYKVLTLLKNVLSEVDFEAVRRGKYEKERKRLVEEGMSCTNAMFVAMEIARNFIGGYRVGVIIGYLSVMPETIYSSFRNGVMNGKLPREKMVICLGIDDSEVNEIFENVEEERAKKIKE